MHFISYIHHNAVWLTPTQVLRTLKCKLTLFQSPETIGIYDFTLYALYVGR